MAHPVGLLLLLFTLFVLTERPLQAEDSVMDLTDAVVHVPLNLRNMAPELENPPALPPESRALQERRGRPRKYAVDHIGDRGIGKGVNLYSLEREQSLGRELSTEVESQARMVRDRAVNEYINRIAQSLVRNSDAKVPFTVKVVDNEEVNAFALPGGFFYINSGLILAADNEAQLATVMAHEIAHVAARHATKNATRVQLFNMASIPLIFFGGPAGYAVRQVAGLAVPMTFLKFSRDAEREADLLGLEYAYAAGYDPVELVHFFESLRVKQRHKLSFVAKAFSNHPLTEERISLAQKEIATLLPPKDQYVLSTSEFEEMKARLQQLANQHHINAGRIDAPVLRRRPATGEPKRDDDGPVLRK